MATTEPATEQLLVRKLYELSNDGCPPHLFKHIEDALEEWGWLIPPWVAHIMVVFTPDAQGEIAALVNYEYRSIVVRISNVWVAVPEEGRGRCVLHELIHIHTNHIYSEYHDLLAATTEEDSALNKWATEKGKQAIERTTMDLERVIWERYRNG
jgi:hypothetical protein